MKCEAERQNRWDLGERASGRRGGRIWGRNPQRLNEFLLF